MSEYDLYSEIICEATRLGHRLFRNQIGRALYRSGDGKKFAVPYGVGGVGGSDLIGWTDLYVYESRDDWMGRHRAVFTAVEVKLPGKRATKEQQAFIRAVIDSGGIAGVCTSVADYRKLIGAET